MRLERNVELFQWDIYARMPLVCLCFRVWAAFSLHVHERTLHGRPENKERTFLYFRNRRPAPISPSPHQVERLFVV